MSAFALLIPPANFSIDLRRRTERSSTAPGNRLQETGFNRLFPVPCSLLPDTRSFGTMLSPGKSSARADSTSELLRFL